MYSNSYLVKLKEYWYMNIMMTVIKAALCVMLLVCSTAKYSSAQPPIKCNMYGFASNGMAPCAMAWVQEWVQMKQQNSTERGATQLDGLIDMILSYANQTRSGINQQLTGFGLPVTLGDLVDLVLEIEPYYIYIFADVIVGYELTEEELQKLGIDPKLAQNPSEVEKFYLSSFEKNCAKKPLAKPMKCTSDWLSDKCGSNGEYMMNLVNYFAGYYCEGSDVAPQFKKLLESGLGKVATPLMKALNIEKSSSSPVVFTVGQMDMQFMVQSACGSQPSLTANNRLLDPTTDVTVDDGFKAMTSPTTAYQNCLIRTWHQHKPEAITSDAFCQSVSISAKYGMDLDRSIISCTAEQLYLPNGSSQPKSWSALLLALVISVFVGSIV